MNLVDTHAHLDFPRFKKDRSQVIERAFENELKYIVNIGADLQSSRNSIKLAEQYDNIYATVGIHPHGADKADLEALKELREMAQSDKVVAIGETGLDFHYDNSPREKQKQAFRAQLRLASNMGLPVVIHAREADEDTVKILKEEGIEKTGGIMHCFASDKKMARKALDLGLYLAFGGLITFSNLDNLRSIVKDVPLDRLLVETDAPYLTPDPYRGKRNEPLYVKHVAEKIAEIKNISLQEVAETTTKNAEKIYKLKG